MPCIGPAGEVYAHKGRPHGFPESLLGSTETVGFDQNVHFERRGRFDAYGFSNVEGVDWDQVDWHGLQQSCLDKNSDRFNLKPRPVPGQPMETKQFSDHKQTHRTAVIFRSHDKMEYTSDVMRNMRAVITELSLNTGGEYQAFLLVQVKDLSLPIFEDSHTYDRVRDELVPHEFQNMTVLWSEGMWPRMYPLLPSEKLMYVDYLPTYLQLILLNYDYLSVHMSQWLPVQYFQKLYPQFDYYWNWEMDVRYTGHYYDLVSALDNWTRDQPRKGLWERNSRFYIPRIHATYQDFRNKVQAMYQNRSRWQHDDGSVWGPQPPKGSWTDLHQQWLESLNIDPPCKSPAQDRYLWGVGEDADLITLLPMFNPKMTWYVFTDEYYNYGDTETAVEPARRTTIITFYRLSSRLLHLMDLENTNPPGHHVSSESFAQTIALHYGLKAVYAPHGLYQEVKWPAQALDFIFNNGDRHSTIRWYGDMDQRGEGSGGPHSPFGIVGSRMSLPISPPTDYVPSGVKETSIPHRGTIRHSSAPNYTRDGSVTK